MKKLLTFAMIVVIGASSIGLMSACKNTISNDDLPTDDNSLENIPETPNYTHSVKIDNEDMFNYYFTFSATNKYDSFYNFGTSSSSKYGTKSTSTITVTPKLTGFVDYSGFVELQAETESENKSSKVLKSRHINIEYWGATIDNYEVSNETQQNDSTISFNDVNYKFKSVDMTITYHHEGISGNTNLSYKTIFMTKYNYTSYLSVNIENQSYRTTSYDKNNYYYDPIYTYHYYQTYTITTSSQIKGYKEFNHIILTFDNGIVIKLDALGKATYKSQEYSVEKATPKLSKINGCIDFYPPAIYEY